MYEIDAVEAMSAVLSGKAKVEYAGTDYASIIFRNEDGEIHRDNGPSVIRKNAWTWNWKGMLHRIGGPATMNEHGELGYYLFGEQYSDDADYELGHLDRTNPHWDEWIADNSTAPTE